MLISEEELRARVAELGREIARDYANENPVLVGVLKGALVFMADLVRATPIDVRHVVVVEDIIDTGRTVSYLKRNLETRHPRSVRLCALLDKIERREVDVDIDYLGFTIPNLFVVGYGLDYNGLYRNLPYIAMLEIA